MNKRIFSLLTSLAMITSMASMTVSAEISNDGSQTGSVITDQEVASTGGSVSATGGMEGYINKEVFSVVVPVFTDTTNVGSELAFTMDPQELIEGTDGGVKGITLTNSSNPDTDDNTLLFPNYTSGAISGYSNTSDLMEITNKSSIDVDVSVAANVTAEGLTLAKANDFGTTNAEDASAHLYLAVSGAKTAWNATYNTDGSGDTSTAIDADGIEVKSQLDKVPDTEFITQKNAAGDGYEYVIDSAKESSHKYSKYSFKLTGSTNPDANWDGLEDATAKVDIVWKITEHVDPHLSATEVSTASPSVTLSATATAAGVTIKSANARLGGYNVELISNGNCTYDAGTGTLTFNADTLANTGTVVTVTFSDGRKETIKIK